MLVYMIFKIAFNYITGSNLLYNRNTHKKSLHPIMVQTSKNIYKSLMTIYDAFTGPCTPTTRFNSISAELLGPVMKLMHEAT